MFATKKQLEFDSGAAPSFFLQSILMKVFCSQITKMAHRVKKSGKKTVSFEKSVSFSDDPPPVTNGFKKDGTGRSDRDKDLFDKNKHLSSKNTSTKHVIER